jgi:hypothetical protein
MGPYPQIHEPGQLNEKFQFVTSNSSLAPVEAQFVVGNTAVTPGSIIHYVATYDFDTRQWGGNLDLKITRQKLFANPRLTCPDGLYAQVLFWAGSTAVDLDVKSATVVVEGTRPTGNLGNNM